VNEIIQEAVMGQTLSEDQRKIAEEAFRKIDSNQHGSISLAELQAVIHENPNALKRQIIASDTDGNKKLNFDEFLIFMKNRYTPFFQEVDVDNSGQASMKEMINWLKKTTQSSGDLAVKFLHDQDTNNDSQISLQEFCFLCYKVGVY